MNYNVLRELLANKIKLQEIKKQTKFLDNYFTKIPLRQRLWHIDNNYFDRVKCQGCQQKFIKWNVIVSKYRSFCGSKCAHNHISVKEKMRQTCLTKYGETTNLKTQKNKDKVKQTNLKRYGVENPFQSDKVKEKIKQTNLKRYGVENPAQSKQIQRKIDETHQIRYNRKRYSQTHIPTDIIDLKNNKDIMYDWHHTQKMSILEIAKTLNVNHSQLCEHFKNNLNISINRHIVSKVELDVQEFLNNLDVVAEYSNRQIIKPKELDVYFPEKKIAIEIDGLAWHTELRGKNRYYHQNKSKLCCDLGIQLIHITDYEWHHKNDIVRSRIKAKLGLNDSVYARKCKIVILSPKESGEFLNKTHIQGSCGAKIHLGLTFNESLISIMTFGKARYANKYEWELIRYASDLNINVVGGASRLFKYFVTKYSPSSIVSYSDKRWNNGNLYKQLEFKHTHTSPPNYWYVYKFHTFESRLKYQKHKLHKILENFDPSQSEWENMSKNKYDRYWDCGNDVWGWNHE